jgi:hypothetical protein
MGKAGREEERRESPLSRTHKPIYLLSSVNAYTHIYNTQLLFLLLFHYCLLLELKKEMGRKACVQWEIVAYVTSSLCIYVAS